MPICWCGIFQDSPDAVVELPELSGGWKLRTLHLSGGKVADFFASSQDQVMLLLPQQEHLRFQVVPLHVIRGAHVANGDFDNNGKRWELDSTWQSLSNDRVQGHQSPLKR